MHKAIKTYEGVEVYLQHFLPREWMEVSGQLHAPAALLSRKHLPVPTVQEAEYTPAPVWTLQRREIPATVENRIPAVQPVAVAIPIELARLLY
jgi:hypothetical protein